MHSALDDTMVIENKIWKGKAYSSSNDTVLVVVMVLMETDGKGNIHVCYPVIIQTAYIMLLAIAHHHHQHKKVTIVD